MKTNVLSILGGMFIILSGCIVKNDVTIQVEKYVHIGDLLPEFSITMNDGKQIETSDLEGKISFLMFFTTAYGDCQKEIPIVQRLYDSFRQDTLVRFICISREQTTSAVQSYWDEHALTLPYSAQENREVYHLFATSIVPRIYISDATLRVNAIFTDSPLATENELREALIAAKTKHVFGRGLVIK